MSAPVPFLDVSEAEQVSMIRDFLAKQGILNIPKSEITQENWEEEFSKLMPFVKALFDKTEVPIEHLSDILLTIATIIILIPPSTHSSNSVANFCSAATSSLANNPDRVNPALFSLEVLFNGLNETRHERYTVFITLLECAQKLKCANRIITDPEFIKELIKQSKANLEEERKLWRQILNLHTENHESKKVLETLVHLLSTYGDDGEEARDDANKCILTAIKDPNMLVYEQLLSLRPIQFMEGLPLYDLLQIFVSGDLNSFRAFAKKNSKLFTDNDLNETHLFDKIRILSFMQLAEKTTEIDYNSLKKLLDLSDDKELRDFIINVVRLKCVNCKLDEFNKKIMIVSTLHRSFGLEQWKNLHETLCDWKRDMDRVNDTLKQMLGTQGAH